MEDNEMRDQNLSEDGQGNPDNPGEKKSRTFTQDEVNALLKREKESSKKALLKELGVEDAKSAKEGLAKYQEALEKDKTDAQKANENLANETKAKLEAEERAKMAEAKLEILTTGGKSEYLDDLITLALQRVSEDKDLTTVVKEMKGDSKYKVFFQESASEDQGTGGGAGYKKHRSPDPKGSLGSRLGSQSWGGSGKNPYFNN